MMMQSKLAVRKQFLPIKCNILPPFALTYSMLVNPAPLTVSACLSHTVVPDTGEQALQKHKEGLNLSSVL